MHVLLVVLLVLLWKGDRNLELKLCGMALVCGGLLAEAAAKNTCHDINLRGLALLLVYPDQHLEMNNLVIANPHLDRLKSPDHVGNNRTRRQGLLSVLNSQINIGNRLRYE